MTCPAPMSRRSPDRRRSRSNFSQQSAAAYAVQEAHLAIAVHVYRRPALLDNLDQNLAGTPVTEVVGELADLINDYPHLCGACAGSLLGIAEQSGRSEEVLAQFSFLHYMPDDFVGLLPSFQAAIEIVAQHRQPLEPLGMAVRWRSDVVNGKRVGSVLTHRQHGSSIISGEQRVTS